MPYRTSQQPAPRPLPVVSTPAFLPGPPAPFTLGQELAFAILGVVLGLLGVALGAGWCLSHLMQWDRL